MNRDRTLPPLPGRGPAAARGFTLIELMISLVVMALVVGTLITVMLTAQRGKVQSSNSVESSQAARVALDMLARDLRSAGYGADIDAAIQQPAIAYIDSLQVLLCANLNPYPDTLSSGKKGSPLAYNPSASPKPFPLSGTSWQPAQRYTTGAEIVRWTLDADNNGVLNAADRTSANGDDASRSRNPNDYELVRQVYGDSTNLSASNNGGNTERVALVLAPGGTVPPMFQVYLSGSTTPYDWSGGPLPASELKNISRVTVQVTAGSSKPDWRGQYSQTTFRTDVSSLRNTPNFGATEYRVSGYVYDDLNRNHVKDTGEPGLAGAMLTMDKLSTVTGSGGYYQFDVPAGIHKMKQPYPPSGYGVFESPDSMSITVPPATTRSWADTSRHGGTVHVHVFLDTNDNQLQDFGESGMPNVKVTLNTGAHTVTSLAGDTSFFAQTGSWSVTCTAPDTCVVTTTNPVTGTMVDLGSALATFAIKKALTGKIQGRVWKDANNDGAIGGTESGIQGVWVGVTDDGGSHILGYAYTDASGNYSIDNIASNDPPKTTPYSVFAIAPTGHYPTTSTSINTVWLQGNQTLTGKDFGFNAFTRISLNATRVLSLGSRDLVEKDWNGSHTENRRIDQDLVLGADAGGTDQVSVWFNPYNSPFSGSPTYTRSAPNAVLALSLDTLETADSFRRPDLVTGTKYTSSGNFFVWLMQNSSGNEGYFPTTYTSGMAYKTSDNGDVTSVLTADIAGNAGADMPDIIVGTKGPTAGQGSVEIWKNNNASPTPAFTRDDIMPGGTGMPAGSMGEVTSMALADFDNDGDQDLVVTTRLSDYTGQVLFFKNSVKSGTGHYQIASAWSFGSDIPSQVVAVDVNQDGSLDVVVGTQNSTSGGALYYLRNLGLGTVNFGFGRRVDAPGIVTSLTAADFGGGSATDVAVGYRSSTSTYAGGIRIYFLDLLNLPTLGVDPSAGNVVNWCPATSPNNFNYGVLPAMPSPPYLTDLSAAVKIDASTGALWLFIR